MAKPLLAQFSTVGSPGFAQDLDELRGATALAFERDPDGRAGRRRQHRAVRQAGNRTEVLQSLRLPSAPHPGERSMESR